MHAGMRACECACKHVSTVFFEFVFRYLFENTRVNFCLFIFVTVFLCWVCVCFC